MYSDHVSATVPGQLPLTPTRTPGFYVAGFVLLISGALYLIFGMKRQWIHCSFSFAYLVAIAITALELLLVPTPVSDGVQGGYIAAVIAGGAVAGGLATLRPKFFHFLGSVLGGFCFAMWLLTLKESALLGQNTLKNCIFLAAFSFLSLGFYCSTKTRHYLVMISSSFAGATAFILGVDCLTCAGLKEFWAWIWDLPNDELFPIDANTYPLTTGIKAELGVLIVIFLLGVVFQWSQLRTIKEERIRKETERDAGRAAVHRTDEKAGLEFQRRIASERRDFETTYHDGPRGTVYEGRGSRTDKFISPLKKLWMSIDGKHARREAQYGASREVDENAENDVESVGSGQASEWASVHDNPKHHIRESVHTADDSGVGDLETVHEHHASGSATTVTRVLTAAEKQEIELDEIRPVARATTQAAMVKDEAGGRVTVQVVAEGKEAAANSWAARNPVPEVTPLPFTVPSLEDDQEEAHADEGDCSSVAVMTEGFLNDEALETRSIGSKRSSFAKRLSTNSAELLRRLSHHSLSNHLNKAVIGGGESTDDLAAGQHDNRSSIAATRDDVSSVNEGDLAASGGLTGERPFSVEIKAQLANNPTIETTEDTNNIQATALKIPVQEDQSTGDTTKEDKGKQVAKEASDDDQSFKLAKTNTSDTPSGPLNLSTGKLEKRVSEIVKKYRINEWTKHQTLAEEPILDDPNIAQLEDPSEAVPVNVEELVKTAETAVPKVAKPRTEALLQARARKASAEVQRRSSPKPENDRTVSMGSEERQAAIQAAAAALVGGTVEHRASAFSPAADVLRSRPPIPGVKSFNTPQSLVAKRETMLRMKQHALRPETLRSSSIPTTGLSSPLASPDHGHGYGNIAALGPHSLTSTPNSTPSSRRNSGTYRHANVSSPLQMEPETDDMPLSQRQAIIRARRSSMESGNSSGNQAGSNGSSRRSFSGYSPGEYASTSSLAVNQNLPHTQRRSFTTPVQTRESQLAGFRSSVQADLRASNANLPVTSMHQQPGFGGGYISNNGMAPINGPLINSVYSIPGTSSANSLLPQQTQPWNAEVSNGLEIQRQYMMAQKENDSRRREARRAERERQSQLRQSSMGTPRFMDAHAAALMNLQKKARDAL